MSRFLKSPVGIGVWLSSALLSVVLTLAVGLPAVFSAALGVAAGCVSSLALLLTPLGARSVVAERDRDRSERDARVLGGVAAARKRLSLLRVADPAVKKELDRLVLGAGKYLEAAVKTDSRDPEVEDAVFNAVEVVNDYLQLVDADSARRRSGEEAIDADLIGRTVRALAASSDEIERRLSVVGSIADRTEAGEELR